MFDFHELPPALKAAGSPWLPQGEVSWWPLVGLIVGGIIGTCVGYCVAEIEFDYPSGFYLGAPAGLFAGAAIGTLGGIVIRLRGGLFRRQFTLRELFALLLLAAVASALARWYVIPFAYRVFTTIEVVP